MSGRFLEWMTGLPPLAVYGVLVVLSAVENIFPPVPADVAVLLGAFLGQRGLTSPVLLGLLCWMANTLSAVAMYYLGRARGPELLEHRWSARLLPPHARAALMEAWERHGTAGIFVSRLLPGVRATVLPFAGMLHLPAPRVIGSAAIASFVWYAALVAAGTAVGHNWARAQRLLENANRVLAVLAVLFVAVVVTWVVRRARHHRERS
jgi:membrane protein DedA with SNARE-associated domain